MDIKKPFRTLDRILQNGTDNVASKANELIGVSNYHISNVLFGAAGLVYGIPGLVELFGKNEPDLDKLSIFGLGLAHNAYQLYRNSRLQAMESERHNQESEAIAIDFKLKDEKSRWIGVPRLPFLNTPPSGKFVYTGWLIVDPFLFVHPFMPYLASIIAAGNFAMLAAQYFRETDYIRPTKNNPVFNFVRSLIPKKSETRYETITDKVQSNNYVPTLK